MLLAPVVFLCAPLFQSPAAGAAPSGGAASPEALSVSWGGLSAWLADPRDAGIVRGLAALAAFLDQNSADDGARAGLLVQRLCSAPLRLRVGGSAAAPVLQLTSYCAGAAEAEWLSGEFRLAFAGHGQEVSADGPTCRVQTPAGAVRFGHLARSGEPALFWLALGGERLEASPPAAGLELRWDARAGSELLRPWITAAPDGEEGWRALEALGWAGAGAGAGSLVVTAEGTGARCVGRRSAGPERGVLSAKTLARLPADSTIAVARACRPAAWLAMLERIDADARAELEEQIAEATGVRLEQDLLAHLGPAAGGFVTKSSGGGLLSGVFFVEVREPVPVAKALGRLVEALLRELDGDRVAVRRFDHGGIACTALAFPGLPIPAEPSYALAGGALYIALSSAGLREALDQLGSGTAIQDHPDVRAAGGRLEGLASFTLFDTPHYASAGYGRVAQFTPMVENLARGMGREISPLLPTLAALSKGSRAYVARSWFEGGELVGSASFDRSLAANLVAIGGSPPFQGLGIASAVAIPRLLAARIAANENAAIATLRHLASAQAQFEVLALVDADGDGIGEYGFAGELCGARPVRGSGQRMEPPVLSQAMAPSDDGQGRGVVVRSGYAFQVWLGRSQGRGVVGVAEPMGRQASALGPTADAAEVLWCCYAWPLDPGTTGNRSFFINQEGDVLVLSEAGRYGGLPRDGGSAPHFDSAYARAGDLSAPLALGGPGADGAVWTVLGLE